MKTLIIHGQSHKGSTYNTAHMLADKIGGEVREFFLPRDFGEFCTGCTSCIIKGEENCPHHDSLAPIVNAILEADVIILASPVYCYHATGAMKAFLDHLAYLWMSHRPDERMFKKQGVCISTAAGAGVKSANKDMADSLFFWGVPKIHSFGIAIAAESWEKISGKKRTKIDKATSAIAAKIKKAHGRVKPGLKTRGFFAIMRMLEKGESGIPKDAEYWKEKGWLESARPWK